MSAAEAAKAWLEANVPVNEHLADQLLIPMVLAGGGSFRTPKPSLHTTTNAEVTQRLVPVIIDIHQASELAWRLRTYQEYADASPRCKCVASPCKPHARGEGLDLVRFRHRQSGGVRLAILPVLSVVGMEGQKAFLASLIRTYHSGAIFVAPAKSSMRANFARWTVDRVNGVRAVAQAFK